MQNNLVDLIVFLARRIRLGEALNEISDESLNKYDKSQISAAYSWLIQKYPQEKSTFSDPQAPFHRVLHFAERMLISPEAYGYLLELVSIGILDHTSMENIIEKVMFQSTERIGMDRIKKLIESHLFESTTLTRNHSAHLRGNETVN
jgi:uncharacterized protein Smg (DUF494 family)